MYVVYRLLARFKAQDKIALAKDFCGERETQAVLTKKLLRLVLVLRICSLAMRQVHVSVRTLLLLLIRSQGRYWNFETFLFEI